MSIRVGIQLYSVRNSLMKRSFGTLDKLAEIGYKYIEQPTTIQQGPRGGIWAFRR